MAGVLVDAGLNVKDAIYLRWNVATVTQGFGYHVSIFLIDEPVSFMAEQT
jgi:hypothetical protein